MTKDDIADWYSNGAPYSAEYQQFLSDTAMVFDALTGLGLFYADHRKAMKAYARYNFTVPEIIALRPGHTECLATKKHMDELPAGTVFVSWRHQVPGFATTPSMKAHA